MSMFQRPMRQVLQTQGSGQFRQEVRSADELYAALTRVIGFNQTATPGEPSGCTIVIAANIVLPKPLIVDTPVTIEGNGVLTFVLNAADAAAGLALVLGSAARGASRITLRGVAVRSSQSGVTPVSIDNTNGATFVRMEDLDIAPSSTADTGLLFAGDVSWLSTCRVAGEVTIDGVRNEVSDLKCENLVVVAGANLNRFTGGEAQGELRAMSNACSYVGVRVGANLLSGDAITVDGTGNAIQACNVSSQGIMFGSNGTLCAIVGNTCAGGGIDTSAGAGSNTIIGNTNAGALTTAAGDVFAGLNT